MKLTNSLFTFLAILFVGAATVYAITSFTEKKLSAKEATQRWGYLKFEAKKFKSGDYIIKSKMASDLLVNNPYLGKTVSQVWNDLGVHDGHYKNDVVPAYILNDDDNDVWQLVFIVDQNRVVTHVAIYKNCCEK